MKKRIEIEVVKAENRRRLEDVLFERLPNLSKMYIRDLIKAEYCEVNGYLQNRGHRLRANDFIEIEIDADREKAMRAEEMDISIVFEDEHLIVVDKAAGILVHPTHRDKSGTLLNALTFYLNRSQANGDGVVSNVRPGMVHRLDKETSGLLIVAKTLRAHRSLAGQFQKKLVRKRYFALVEGHVAEEDGTIVSPIGRTAELKKWHSRPDGKHAETRFWVRERGRSASMIELEPVTGRTNQLRIHCEHIGHPIIGDTIRGGRNYQRLCLHAQNLSFLHPATGQKMSLESPARFEISDVE